MYPSGVIWAASFWTLAEKELINFTGKFQTNFSKLSCTLTRSPKSAVDEITAPGLACQLMQLHYNLANSFPQRRLVESSRNSLSVEESPVLAQMSVLTCKSPKTCTLCAPFGHSACLRNRKTWSLTMFFPTEQGTPGTYRYSPTKLIAKQAGWQEHHQNVKTAHLHSCRCSSADRRRL